MRLKWSEEEDRLLREVWAGESNRNIILKSFPNRTWHSIRGRAQNKLKIKCLVNRVREGTLRPLLEENLESYYWYGYFLADGWFNIKTNQYVVIAGEKDKDHLKKLAKFLDTKVHNIGISKGSYENSRDKYRIAIQDLTYGPLFVQKFNITVRKTYNPPDVSWIEEDNFLAMLAGFIDGDGSTYGRPVNRIKIECHSSWMDTFVAMKSKLENMFTNPISIPHINKRGYVNWNIGKEISFNLSREFRNLQLPIMERKWNNI